MNKILHGDSLKLLKDMKDNTIDSIVTDPPYGYSFMGKDWDKAVPSVELWEECLRVLKPGGFAFIMSAPRADVQGEMIKRLEKAGFRVDFTPVYWTYATGFPKAANMGNLVDKRLGAKRKVVGKKSCGYQVSISKTRKEQGYRPNETNATTEVDITEPASDEAKKLDGSFAGYQPKPAVEVIIVVMKPLSEKSFMDQALKNGKGVTWLNDLRIPFEGMDDFPGWWKSGAKGSKGYLGTDTFKIRDMSAEEIKSRQFKKTNRKPRPTDSTWAKSGFKSEDNDTAEASPLGRFAANLLVQDDVLGVNSDGASAPTTGKEPSNSKSNNTHGDYQGHRKALETRNDKGTYSRYYSLDAWWESRIKKLPLNVQTTYPFMIVPKASKSEKNNGLDGMDKKVANSNYGKGGFSRPKEGEDRDIAPTANFHPTVKPISLMSYLVTLGSREGDVVLDPFVGSGTTCIAAKLENRKYVGMELDDEYVVIAKERIKSAKPKVNPNVKKFW